MSSFGALFLESKKTLHVSYCLLSHNESVLLFTAGAAKDHRDTVDRQVYDTVCRDAGLSFLQAL